MLFGSISGNFSQISGKILKILLSDIKSLSSVIIVLGGTEAAIETCRALLDVNGSVAKNLEGRRWA